MIMRAYIIIGLVLWIGLLGCNTEGQKRVLEEEEMKEILIEFHLAEAVANRSRLKLEERKALLLTLQDAVLDRYELDRETFYENYTRFLADPKNLQVMYDSIVQRIVKSIDLEEEREFNPESLE